MGVESQESEEFGHYAQREEAVEYTRHVVLGCGRGN